MRERGEVLLRSLPGTTQAVRALKHAFGFCDRAHTNEHVFGDGAAAEWQFSR